MKNYLLLFIVFFGIQCVTSQVKISDAGNIKTVVFNAAAANTYTPIVQLGQRLMLSFDDINADERDYYYKVEHCDENWNRSNLSKLEYINGFSEDRIRTYNNSFNTLQPYTNYQLELPNEYTKMKISGNYLLSVLNDRKEVVFQRKFILYEPKVTVAVTVHKSRDISQIDTHQTVQYVIHTGGLRLNNPNEEIKTVLLQNNNWQTAITGLKPQYMRGNQLLYLYNKETTYWGGNEFLYFDTKAIRDATLNIASARLEEDLYHTYLYTNEARKNQPYTLLGDINGNFFIRTLYGEYQNIEADYTRVYFSLENVDPNLGKEIYIHGNFNNWELNDFNRMTYNSRTNLFEATLLIKQGFYNYQFVTLDGNGKISNHDIDGSHYQTENDYTVLVYFKRFGARYTSVIGVGFGGSKVILN